jgi:hypothetical protein
MHTQVHSHALVWVGRAFEGSAGGVLRMRSLLALGIAEHGSRGKMLSGACSVRRALACSIVTVRGRYGAIP